MEIFVREGPLHLEAGMDIQDATKTPCFLTFGKDLNLNYLLVQIHLEEAVLDPKALKSNPANFTLFLTKESRKYSYQKVNLFSYGHIPPFSEDK
ncbi:hypothetical protein CHS0354_016807 [Potamilus streckersoni]|uniref:Uncharacterized protein n=1 Tax=Potamilus streckersoni TaxID=2493646 RepID=A0AAE0T394_9BIVA|nr:hypothetical protein CHS0354_016807 [Potamilus streckersoni]